MLTPLEVSLFGCDDLVVQGFLDNVDYLVLVDLGVYAGLRGADIVLLAARRRNISTLKVGCEHVA